MSTSRLVRQLAASGASSALACAALLAACGAREGAREKERPVTAAPRPAQEHARGVVELDAKAQEAAGLVTAPLAPASRSEELQALGRVLAADELAQLTLERAQATAQRDRAEAALDAARAQYDRVLSLNADQKNASDRALEAARAAWKGAEADAGAARQALLRQQDVTRQRWGGTVAAWMEAGAGELQRLLRGEDVLLQVSLRVGETVASPPRQAHAPLAGGAPVPIHLVSPAPRVDPRLQGESFFYRASARAGLLPGNTVAVLLPAGAERTGFPIPASAVVWWQGKAWVYVQVEPDRFARRGLSAADATAEGWFASAGFVAGERLVVTGAQVLLSEEGRSQMPQGAGAEEEEQ